MFFSKFKKKKVYIHIGHGKTGTSAIQKFLSNESLRDDSKFLYPKTTFIGDGHHFLFKSSKENLKDLFREIKETSKKNIIISSECGLPNIRHFVENAGYRVDFFRDVAKEFDTEVIYYVRNHFQMLESSFFQHIKVNDKEFYLSFLENNFDKLKSQKVLQEHFFPSDTEPSLWTHIIPTRQFDYYENVNGFWGQIVGKGNVKTKTYSRENLINNNIVEDFVTLLDPAGKFLKPLIIDESVENKTDVYAHNAPGFLLNEKVKDNIRRAFLESSMLYAKNYLGTKDADLLLRGF